MNKHNIEERLNRGVLLMPRMDKIKFLLKSGLFDINTLQEQTEQELNDLTISGLIATGFNFNSKGGF